jgi:AraC-like DNA-binding protein
MYSQSIDDEVVALRRQQRTERDGRIRQRILAMLATNRELSPKEIAAHVGVSVAYVERVLSDACVTTLAGWR